MLHAHDFHVIIFFKKKYFLVLVVLLWHRQLFLVNFVIEQEIIRL
jgi:hypothetical protein